MNITKRVKVIAGAVALAGAVSLTGGAFTASGVSNEAGSEQFIGGTVSQTVTGAATLESVDYTFATAANTSATAVQLTFTSMDDNNSDVSVSVNGGSSIDCTGNGTLIRTCELGGVTVDTLAITVAAPGTFDV